MLRIRKKESIMKYLVLTLFMISNLSFAAVKCDVSHYNYLLRDASCGQGAAFIEVFSTTDPSLELISNNYDRDHEEMHAVLESETTRVSIYYDTRIGYGASQAEVDQFSQCVISDCYISPRYKY